MKNRHSIISLTFFIFLVNLIFVHAINANDMLQHKFISPAKFPKYVEDWDNQKYDLFYGKRDTIYLNGWWEIFKLKNTKNNPRNDYGRLHGFSERVVDTKQWDKIFVPWDWNDKNYKNKFKGVGWYRNDFFVPMKYSKQTFVLKFHSILSDAEVWINGKFACKYKAFYFNNLNYRSAYSGYKVDITKDTIPGIKNVIAVRVYHAYGKKPRGGIDGPIQINIYPNIYVNKILVTPNIAKKQISLNCSFVNNTGSPKEIDLNLKLDAWKSYRYNSPDQIKSTNVKIGKLILPPGKLEKTFVVSVKSPVLWSYERPNLYHLCLFQGKQLIGQTRFGFRQVTINGRHFYLNGKKMWLPTAQLCPGISRLSNIWAWNQEVDVLKKLIAKQNKHAGSSFLSNNIKQFFNRYKKQNIIMLRAHSDCWTEPQFDLVDEIGMLVYPELASTKNGARRTPDVGGKSLLEEFNKNRSLPEGAKKMWKNRMYTHWNHPSIWAYSIGNEMYSSEYTELMCAMFKYLKNELKIQFPISQSGRYYATRSHDKFTPLPDFYDDHYYWTWENKWENMETQCSRLKDNYINEKTLDRPWFNGECFGVFRVHHYLYLFKKLMQNLPNIDRKKYVELVTKKQRGNRTVSAGFGKRNLLLYGIRDFLHEPEKGDVRRAEYYKRLAETHRRWNDYTTGFATHRIWPPHLDRMTPLGEMIKQVNSPIYACTNLYFKHHFFSGKELQTTIYTFNDSLLDVKNVKVNISLINKQGQCVYTQKLVYKELKQGVKKKYNFIWKIPPKMKTSAYRFKMNINQGGKDVVYNSYRVYILGKDKRALQVKTEQRIALYGTLTSKIFKGTKFDNSFTQGILDGLKIKYQLCDNFDKLRDYDILIFGVNSFDDKLRKNGEKVRQWIEKGGKVLCFEQPSFLGPIPFAAEYTVCDVRGSRITFADFLVPQHPIFEGTDIYDWDMWDGGELGKIGSKIIQPLADSALAVSGTYGNIGMLITEVKIGKGTVLISLPEASLQYNEDSVATRYIDNLLKYVLQDGSKKLIRDYAVAKIKGNKVKEYHIPKLQSEKSFFVDLRKVANRGFFDEKGRDGIGGWFDEGATQNLKLFPVGKQDFKGVSFDIINPSKNHQKSCIVLNSNGNKRYPMGNRKDQVEINVGRKAKRLVFLVAAAWCPKQGVPIAEFYIKYKGGTCFNEIEKIELTPGINISDWFIRGGALLPKAKLAWSIFDRSVMSKIGVWMFQWDNPQLQGQIEKIIFKTKHKKAIPALIAITGESIKL